MADILKQNDIFDRISQPGGAFTVKQAEALREVFLKIEANLAAVESDITSLDTRVTALETP